MFLTWIVVAFADHTRSHNTDQKQMKKCTHSCEIKPLLTTPIFLLLVGFISQECVNTSSFKSNMHVHTFVTDYGKRWKYTDFEVLEGDFL